MVEAFVTNRSLYPSFSEAEMHCKHTGLCEMADPAFMRILQAVRTAHGRPMAITSGYRHPRHLGEARQRRAPGEHTRGRTVDVAVNGGDALRLLEGALAHGITGIGVQRTGVRRFLHLRLGGQGLAAPMIWRY